MEGAVVKISELATYLKENNLMIGPRAVFDENFINGMPLLQFQKKKLRQNLLSCKDISDARLWGAISQKHVYNLVVANVPNENIISVGRKKTIKIPRETVINIAASRGFKF